jgi:hypothetical protein
MLSPIIVSVHHQYTIAFALALAEPDAQRIVGATFSTPLLSSAIQQSPPSNTSEAQYGRASQGIF